MASRAMRTMVTSTLSPGVVPAPLHLEPLDSKSAAKDSRGPSTVDMRRRLPRPAQQDDSTKFFFFF